MKSSIRSLLFNADVGSLERVESPFVWMQVLSELEDLLDSICEVFGVPKNLAVTPATSRLPENTLPRELSARKPLINRETPIALAMERGVPYRPGHESGKELLEASGNFRTVQTNLQKLRRNF